MHCITLHHAANCKQNEMKRMLSISALIAQLKALYPQGQIYPSIFINQSETNWSLLTLTNQPPNQTIQLSIQCNQTTEQKTNQPTDQPTNQPIGYIGDTALCNP